MPHISSLRKAKSFGLNVRELCFSDAFRPGQWIHRNDVLSGATDLRLEAVELWPDAKVVEPIGIVTDTPEVFQS